MNKKAGRLKRAKSLRMKARELEMSRLCVHRTSRHLYAQVISADGATIITQVSTLNKEVGIRASNIVAAKKIGELIAKRALDKGIAKVVFDRSGFNYHGCVKAIADAARENGLQF